MEIQTLKNDQLVGLRETAEYAHITREGISQAIKRGILKAEKIDGVWVTSKGNVDEYIAQKYNREDKAKDQEGKKIFDIAKGVMSARAASKYLSERLGRKFSIMRIYYMLDRGYLVGYKKGKAWVIMQEDLEDIVKIETECEMSVLQK